MFEKTDIAEYIRDLFYIEEDILALLKKHPLAPKKQARYFDQTIKKQVIISKMLDLLLNKQQQL